jgi:hypothetical protein
MCGFVQHNSRCNHVSSCIIRHREQLILGNSLLFMHLLMLSNVLAKSSLFFFSTFSKYGFRCLIGPLYG